jgi:GNAT superfamily N-acetyltransferase
MIEIVPATMDHARRIALRAADAREIAALGFTKEEGIGLSLSRAVWAEAYLVQGQVAAIVGVSIGSLLGEEATPWLVTGRPVDRHKRAFLRLTRAGVARMLRQFPVLINHVHAEYTEALRWLRWLGFTIERPAPHGLRDELFCRVCLRKGVAVQDSSVTEIESAARFRRLAAEYAAESAIAGLPPPSAKRDAYLHLERSGLLHMISATRDGQLIGLIAVLMSTLPHYGVPVAVSESFFVSRAYRKTGAGLRLLRAAEEKASALGSPGLLVSAPFEGDLFQVLPRVGYRETNRVFFKSLGVANG